MTSAEWLRALAFARVNYGPAATVAVSSDGESMYDDTWVGETIVSKRRRS